VRNQKGFTLIELMIVVAIIAILAAIAISQYQDYVIRSQISEGAALAEGVKSAVVEFYNKRGRFPIAPCLSSNTSLGLAQPASIVGNYVSEVTVAGANCAAPLGSGSILSKFSSTAPFQANDAIDTAGLIFSPVTHAGSIEWHCKRFLVGGSVVLRDKWLPSSCRG
jgi:type IV pilus assembly protein PilA